MSASISGPQGPLPLPLREGRAEGAGEGSLHRKTENWFKLNVVIPAKAGQMRLERT